MNKQTEARKALETLARAFNEADKDRAAAYEALAKARYVYNKANKASKQAHEALAKANAKANAEAFTKFCESYVVAIKENTP